MISLGSGDGRKGLGLGFDVGGEMEETELEEGEACYYHNDDDSAIDPDVALSYIDEKLQDVLGHFQKDFEGGVSAENLGAKFGGYGSFLPTYQRSPAWSHPRTPPKVHNYSEPRSPNNLHPEGGRHSLQVQPTASVSARFGPASVNGVSLPALKVPSVNDSVKQDVCLLSTHAEDSPSKFDLVTKSANPLDQKNLKVRIKVSSDNLLTRKNAEIYSGLGLDVSPSSSLDGSPTDSDGLSHKPLDAPYESPTSILQIMTSFPVHGNLLLSPLPDDLNRLIEKAKFQGTSRSGSMHKGSQESSMIFMNGSEYDRNVLGEKKSKLSEKHDISRDLKNENGNDARNSIDVLLKKEIDIDILACEEIVSNALRLPLLSNSLCNVVDSAKGNSRDIDTSSFASKGGMKQESVSHPVKEEPLEPVSTQENGGVEKPTEQAGSDGKVWENKKASTDDGDSAYRRKGVDGRGEKTDIPAKGDSNVSKGRKALEAELIDPPKLKSGRKATSHEEDGIKVVPRKEQSSSGGKKKSKGSRNHGAYGAEVPKDGLEIDSCTVPESRKSTHANSYVSKIEVEDVRKDYGKARDRYKDFFGDIELEQGDNAKASDEMAYADSLKHSAVIENGLFEFKGASRERTNVKKFERSSTSGAYPRTASNVAPLTAGAVPPVVKEDWVCCDKCQKWRLLPLGTNPDSLPEKWLCSMLYWLPGFNRCSISEEETTKALITRYQVPAPAPASQSSQHDHAGGILLGVSLVEGRHSDQNQHDLSLHVLPGGKKKYELKDVSNANNQDGPQFSNSMKKNPPQASVKCRSINGENQSPTVNEVDFLHSGQSSSLVVEKSWNKQKEKKKLLESHSGGGDSQNSKIRNKRDIDQDCVGASKKIKTDDFDYSDEDRTSDHGGGILKLGRSTSSGLSIQEGENDHRREKRARVSKSGGEETCTSKGSGRINKKGTSMMEQQLGPDLGSTQSQRSVDAIGSLKRDTGSVQLLTATSSSSKVSSSHKDKANLQEVKGSPVESVSSSPLRISDADKFTSTRRNLGGKNDSQAGFFATASSRKCLDGEDDGGSDRSGTARKDETVTVTHRGSLETSALDFQDRALDHMLSDKAKEFRPSEFATHLVIDDAANTIGQVAQYPCKPQASDHCPSEERGNDSQYHANGSHPRKSGKGSSSRSKDKSKSARSEFDKGNLKTSDSFNKSVDHTPYDENSKAGRNKFQEKFAVNSDRVEKSLVSKKDSTGKLFGESGKRESQSKFGQHDGSDVRGDAISNQELKPNQLLDRDGEKSSKRFPSDKTERAHDSVRGKSHSLPPSGRVPNETSRWPQSISGFQKENGTNALLVDACEGDDPLKAPKQVKKGENQNGNQPIKSKHTMPNGVKVKRDLDAPSPVRRDSSNQAASNAVKEAKDLKHLADRLKNSGSNAESTGIYFQAALKFLHGASLLESCNSESTKHGEMIQSIQMYSSTAKLCEFCAHEYEKSKDMAAAALAYKCMEVAYFRVIYSSHSSASRDRHELQTTLLVVPPGESPSSSASDIENLNHPATVDKAALAKGVSSTQVAGNHVIAARNRSNFVRLLNFTQDVNFAMEASRKARIAFAAASPKLGEAKYREGISSVKKALDFNFQDVEGLLHMVRVAMEIISH